MRFLASTFVVGGGGRSRARGKEKQEIKRKCTMGVGDEKDEYGRGK